MALTYIPSYRVATPNIIHRLSIPIHCLSKTLLWLTVRLRKQGTLQTLARNDPIFQILYHNKKIVVKIAGEQPPASGFAEGATV